MIHNLACLADYENNAKVMMAPPTFNQLRGSEEANSAHHDFNAIKMKLRGLANLKHFINPLDHQLLGIKVKSPVGLAAYPHQCIAH